MYRIIIILLLSVVCSSKIIAQNDPVLAGMIHVYTDKAEKELKNQEKIMLMQTTGHVWLKEEVENTANLQKEFNNYISTFRGIVVYAAQIYGFYYEIDCLVKNMDGFTRQLDRSTSNALAVALSTKRNQIYRELIMGSVEIVNDIRLVCLSDNKMTEKERIEIVFNIRPKLKIMNQRLQRLTRAVKYTSMSDIWLEIDEGSNRKADKESIVKQCMNRWKRSSRQH